ncbi:MAG: AAA family ATPase [Acidobacteria bacterium]|nr:AAA family ATPase [Acidobacteriota bacterium]
MYEKFYGLKERAFNLTPDPTFLFLNNRSREALDHILYGIERREGFALIVGDIGTGKTTLCWTLLERLEKKRVRTALIQNPLLPEADILRSILQDLGARAEEVESDSPTDANDRMQAFNTEWLEGLTKKQLLDRLNRFLAARAQEDVFTVLIVDEAQNISITLLEQLRLLSNLETAKKKLLQIIFVGQLELEQKLKAPSMRQLNQRISVRFETRPFSKADTEKYIRHRLAKAGGGGKVRFRSGAFKAVWRYSKGCPRLINLICDRAFLAAYSERSLLITSRHIRKAARALEGKEYGVEVRSGWFRKAVPYLVPAFLLLVILFFVAYKGLANL